MNEINEEPQVKQTTEVAYERTEVRTEEPLEGNAVAPEVERDYEIRADRAGDEVATPSPNIRGVSINPLSSGYMVKVGCQSVAVESTEKLIDMLSKYLTDPADFEKKWYSKEVRNRLENI